MIRDTYDFCQAWLLILRYKIVMIVVSPRAQVACLAGASVVKLGIFEAPFLRKNLTGSIHGLFQEVEICTRIILR